MQSKINLHEAHLTKTINGFSYPTCIVLFFVCILSCKPTRLIREFYDPVQFASTPYESDNIKIHMKDGCLYVLDSCLILSDSDTIRGYGLYYDQNRNVMGISKNQNSLPFAISINNVALIETNEIKGLSSKVLSMAIVGVPTEILSWYCIINPKACFGSCPTFYAWNGNEMRLMAEGFSSSIMRSLEKKDVDMLYGSVSQNNNIHLKLTNEALETHVIRYAKLLYFPRNKEERVFAAPDGRFFVTSHIQSPSFCSSAGGDCRDKVLYMDQNEEYSSANPKDLARDEYIHIVFDTVPEGNLGLIIGCRQTLMTTYLFYQGMAYLGNATGYLAARIESGDIELQKRAGNLWKSLGGIEVLVQNDKGRMICVDTIEERGPIASDIHLVPLPGSMDRDLRISLKLNQGLWRIDYLALAKLEKETDPITIFPSHVFDSSGENNRVKESLSGIIQPLVTLPGDVYDLYYELPDVSDGYDVFLSTQGYYLEWMRQEWLAEENLAKASLMFGMPKFYMRKAAHQYSKIESSMEETFWNSRYAKKP